LKRSWRDATVLVTGASGVTGAALLQTLKKAGYTAVVSVAQGDADLTDAGQASALMRSVRPVLVFHLAARVYGIVGNLKNKGPAFLDNIRMNTNVIEAAREVGVKKIVAMGSTAVYSDIAPMPMREEDIWLGPPHHSEAPYAHAKRAMLAQLETYREAYGLDFAFCVSTNLYGPGDKFDEQFGHVIPALISKFHRGVVTGEPIHVWGTGSPKRDFLYSEDAGRALVLVAEEHSGSINLASGMSVTIAETVELLRAVTGFSGNIVWDRSKPDGQMLRSYDITKLHALGFTPRHTLEQGLKETVTWFNEHLDAVRR
jgi:GDP-L-fucose synthase